MIGEEPTVWERLIPTKSILNFRDLGNYETVERDAVVKTGRLFRSANPESAFLNSRPFFALVCNLLTPFPTMFQFTRCRCYSRRL